MDIERKVLRSVSEFSMFKYLLVFYLIFFILNVILMGILGLIAWLGLSSFGFDINNYLAIYGLGQFSDYYIMGSGILTIVIFILGGLFFSILYAALGTLVVWIMNIVLKVVGGVELRFFAKKEEVVSPKKSK